MKKGTDSSNKVKALTDAEQANLRLEYEKTQDMAVHYDILNWTISSILIAGVFISIGILGERTELYPFMAVFSLIPLLVWRLFYRRHKGIQKIKFQRLHAIEKKLNLEQHLRVHSEDKAGKIFGVKGDHCATFITLAIPASLILMYLLQISPLN